MYLKPQAKTILRDLEEGNTINAEEARTLYGVQNLYARISELRKAGYCIYSNRSGRNVSYRLGAPTRSMIQYVYRTQGSSFFEGN